MFQTEQVMKNIAAILKASGTSMRHAVKATVFIKVECDFGLDLGKSHGSGSGFFIDPDGPRTSSASASSVRLSPATR